MDSCAGLVDESAGVRLLELLCVWCERVRVGDGEVKACEIVNILMRAVEDMKRVSGISDLLQKTMLVNDILASGVQTTWKQF